MNKSKRKLLISMLVAMFVLLSAVAIVAIAFALTQQTITSTLTIGYTVEDIDGSVYATYKIGNGEEKYLVPTGADNDHINNNSLVFKAEDKGDAGSLQFPTTDQTVALDSQNDNIVLKYTYSNTGGKHYIASMSFASNVTTDNMDVEYGIWDSSTNSVKYSTDRYAVVVPAGATEKSYWIKISIINKAKGASFSGDFRWNLSGCNQNQASADYLSLTSLTFTGSNGSYSASISSTGDYTGAIVFPSQIGDDTVTSIVASGTMTDEEKAKITEVVIPDSVTKIGDSAFNGFAKLQRVTFEQNATTSSASVQSSTGLQTIGVYAFFRCTSLTNITLPSTTTSLGKRSFSGCTSLTNFIIPNGVEKINAYAFSGCTGLITLTIPSSVTSIGNDTFSGCSNLTSVTFENTTGWWYADSSTATSGTSIDVTNPETNATNLKTTYSAQYWTRS